MMIDISETFEIIGEGKNYKETSTKWKNKNVI